jgi:4-amino-4-deoxy-L-arabinose transferase-like glycosyltransferase
MSTTAAPPLPRLRTPQRSAAFARVKAAVRPELALLLILAGLLNLWALDLNGYANDYYAAAVRSMTSSWHDFLYASFDVAGVQTVDKPPLALWVQALSAKAFGFSSWSLLVPQALMGVATVGLVYDMTLRRFGRSAAFAAGMTLVLTPITVAISRHNNPDALLILCITAALWAMDRGLREGGRARWLVASGVFVGLGFETKMAAALLVVPGIVAAWAWVAPRGRAVAARQLAGFAAAMTAVGLAWPVLVWLTPSGSRPYVSGTDDNSIWSLIFGYNGLGRLFGQSGGPTTTSAGGGSGVFGGATGPFRLLNQALGGQGGWLLGFALVAGVALVAATRVRRTDARTGWLIAVGGAFAVTAITFSRAEGIFHPYYVSALAPFTALLVGAGFALMRPADLIGRVGGPLMLLGGAATEAVVIRQSATDLSWASGIVVAASVAGAAGLAVVGDRRVRHLVAAAAVAVLLVAPGTWAVQTLGHATSSTFPAGGPSSAATMGMGGGMGGGVPQGGGGRGGTGGTRPAGAPPSGAATGGGATTAGGTATVGGTGGGLFSGDTTNLTAALTYAKAHGGGTIAIASQSGASAAIIASGADVAALGGFSGSETTTTTQWLAQAVASGKIRYVLVSSTSSTTGGMSDGRAGSTAALAAAAKVGTAVSSVSGLYDLQGTASALLAAS